MIEEISELQKKRAYNQIWNAAADYGFIPDFRFYTEDGIADVYWNSLIGLARKHYDYDRLKQIFRSLEQEEDADIFAALPDSPEISKIWSDSGVTVVSGSLP